MKILVNLPALILAVSFHEAAHAWVADKLGDSTARLLGRVSLNPIRHVDLIGSIIVPIALALMPGGFMFGWAKPVPVNSMNLGNPKRDDALVSAAGPASNLVLALFAAILMRLAALLPDSSSFLRDPLLLLMFYLVFIDVILAVFNMIPIPPLDGSGVLAAFLPDAAAEMYLSIRTFGMFIIMALVVADPLGIWSHFFSPVVMHITNIFGRVAGPGFLMAMDILMRGGS